MTRDFRGSDQSEIQVLIEFGVRDVAFGFRSPIRHTADRRIVARIDAELYEVSPSRALNESTNMSENLISLALKFALIDAETRVGPVDW